MPTHCPTLSYLAELYVETANPSSAVETALRLCESCGSTSPPALQAKVVFDASGGAVEWPAYGACHHPPPPALPPPPPPASPPPMPPPTTHVVAMRFVVAGTVESFDQADFKTRLAAQIAGISVAEINLTVAAASVGGPVRRPPRARAPPLTREIGLTTS